MLHCPQSLYGNSNLGYLVTKESFVQFLSHMRVWKGTLHCTEKSQLAINVHSWGWSHVDEVWFDFFVEIQDNMLKFPNTTSQVLPHFHLNHGMFWLQHHFPVMSNGHVEFSQDPLFSAFLIKLQLQTHRMWSCFYTVSWHVEEWSTGVWGKWFTAMGLSRGLICHASRSHALFPSSLSLSQRQCAAHRWQWKGLPSHSSN